ncbi:MAG: CRISPR-associated endonuclease Cas2 [Opitutales bacterium]|nr:CRISPR-associated endonuclease Cas2 [Opitutales bacterium]
MRRNFIVTYDIRDPKRLRRVFKLCKGYGMHLQYSVFECDLTEAEKTEMEARLADVMNLRDDQVLFIDLGPAAARAERTITALGQAYSRVEAPCFVL